MKRPLILLLVFIMIILNGFVFKVIETEGHGHDDGDNQGVVQVEMGH